MLTALGRFKAFFEKIGITATINCCYSSSRSGDGGGGSGGGSGIGGSNSGDLVLGMFIARQPYRVHLMTKVVLAVVE